MMNVDVKITGPSVTPRAEDSSTAVAEAELFMTSGLLIVIMMFGVCICVSVALFLFSFTIQHCSCC